MSAMPTMQGVARTFYCCFLVSVFFLLLLAMSFFHNFRQSTLRKSPSLKIERQVEKEDFRPESTGVVVFLHIQKTGGSDFGKKLLKLDVGRPCKKLDAKKKRSRCLRPGSKSESWLFSRYTQGWPCAVHADWTELHGCVRKTLNAHEGVRKRRFFYVTMLREPLHRFVSEFAHVKRGATWLTDHHCDGQLVSPKELPACYDGFYKKKTWPDLTMEKFLNCPSNLAINRQTRMLADLTLVDCYSDAFPKEEREKIILESAKANLRSMAFVGLMENQQESQDLFEHIFNYKFSITFVKNGLSKSGSILEQLSKEEVERIRQVNWMDFELYEFAEKLFLDQHRLLANGSLKFKNEWKRFLLAGDEKKIDEIASDIDS